MLKTKRISLLFLISCMIFVLCSCGVSDELWETSKGNTDTGRSDDVEAFDDSLSSEKLKNRKIALRKAAILKAMAQR